MYFVLIIKSVLCIISLVLVLVVRIFVIFNSVIFGFFFCSRFLEFFGVVMKILFLVMLWYVGVFI